MTNMIARSHLNRSPELQQPPTTIYSFAVIVEPCDPTSNKERHSLVACFKESPFPFEIDEWAKSFIGNDYRVADSFLLEEINL